MCVSEEHPKGTSDWERFCRKHQGFFGVDEEGAIVDGVAHVDPLFSPYAPPDADSFHAANARMLQRAQERAGIAELWAVGQDYADTLVHTVRLLPERQQHTNPEPAAVVMRQDALDLRPGTQKPWRVHPVTALALIIAVVAAGAGYLGTAAATTAIAVTVQLVIAAQRGRAIAHQAAQRPSIEQIAYAVADALNSTDLSPVGAEAVRIEVDEVGEYRCSLYGVAPDVSALFATALDEVVSPMVSPRYVLPRWVVAEPRGLADGLKAATNRLRATGEVWHSVPGMLATNARNAQAFARAWDHWVGGGSAIYTGSPEGEGVLVTHRGSDPFDMTTVLRVHWR